MTRSARFAPVARPRARADWTDAATSRSTAPEADCVLRLQAGAGNHATTALLAPCRGGPSLQRMLTHVFASPRPDWFEPFAKLGARFNELLKPVTDAHWWTNTTVERRAALEKLAQLERALYDWFGSRVAATVATTRDGAAMGDLLNQVQRERIGLVGRAVSGKDVDPPLGNFRTLDVDDQAHARAIWKSLLASQGIAIKGNDAFRGRMLADFARLLETATGRALSGAIVGTPDALTITATTLAGGKFAAGPVKSDREELEEVKQPDDGDWVTLDFTPAYSVDQRKGRLNAIRTRHPKALGFSVITGDGTRHFRFNAGTRSTMTVPADAVDASLHPSSRLLGVHGEEIIGPTFVNLGHELGHVLRSLQGISGGHALIKHAFPDVHSDERAEEFFNIDAVENRIRAEAGLSRRGGHTNWVGREMGQLYGLVNAVRDRAAAALTLAGGDTVMALKQVLVDCDGLLMSALPLFGKRGGDPRGLRDAVTALDQRTASLEARVRPAQNRALIALKRSARPARLQRLSVDDRRWAEVSAVTHLGANAFELSTAVGESVVVKRSGKGLLAFDPGAEGPVREALAARLGEIAGLGVATARTVMIETRGDEGKHLLAHLRKLSSAGHALADDLAGTDVILVMQRAPGTRADKAATIIAQSSRADRIALFARLGRLWAFDVLINNTDRIQVGNWGNVVLGPGGSVVGIDQMIGLLASDRGAEFAADEAAAKLKIALDPPARRDFARETFRSLSRHLGPEFSVLEGLFVLQFERGALEGIEAIARLDPLELAVRQAKLPAFAQKVAGEIGLGGAAALQGAFAGSHAPVAKQLALLRDDIAARAALAHSMRADLAAARGRRRAILDELGARADALEREWITVEGWGFWRSKDSRWTELAGELIGLRDFGRHDFMEAGRIAGGAPQATVKVQIADWTDGLQPVWDAANRLAEPLRSAHATIRPLIVGLRDAVRHERLRVPLMERV